MQPGRPGLARSIFRDASRYTLATYTAQVGSFVVGLITKGLLGPTNVGIWSLINILLGYLAASQIGAGDAIAKEVPYLRAKGEDADARRLANAMLGFVLVVSTVVALGALVITLRFWERLGPAYRVGLLIVGLSFPLWMLMNMQTVMFRASKRFDVLSTQLLLQLGVSAIVGIPLIWRFSIYGQYAVFLLSLVASVAYLGTRGDSAARFHPALDRAATRRVLAVGLPLQLSGLVFIIQTTADSLLAARLLGVTALGYYSLAVTVKGYVYQTPNAFSVVMFPRFQERFAASQDDPKSLREFVEKPILGLACVVLPVLIGATWQVVPLLVRHFLPAFIPAVPAIKILLVGTFFASLWHMPLQFLIAINKLWHSVAIAAGNATLVILGVLVVLSRHADLQGVAIGTSVAYALALVGTAGYVVSHFRSPVGVVGFLAEILAAGALLFTGLVVADRLIPDAVLLPEDVLRAVLRSLALLIPGALLFWRADRSLNLRQYLPFGRVRP